MTKMTVKEFVEAVHKAWADDFFLGGMPIKSIKYWRQYGMDGFVVQCVDKTTHTICLMEDGRISFF